MKLLDLFCCGCSKSVKARLTDGAEIYPHRSDLKSLPFWKCDACGAYVGCHHKTKHRTRPLGNLPDAEMRKARKHIHSILDPLWKTKKAKRGDVYKMISNILGYEYHTGELKSIDEARRVYKLVRNLNKEFRA